MVVKEPEAMFVSMTEPKTKEEVESCKLEPEDYEPYVDPIGVTHWLPPKRCRDCGD